MRHHGGRPPEGVRARVFLNGGYAGQIQTVMNRLDAKRMTAEFRFMVQKTHDPQAVYHNALKTFCERYYQTPMQFDDRLAALFSFDSVLAGQLLESDQVKLEFVQKSQGYTLFSTVHECSPGSTEYEATYWHNRLFNPHLPGRVRVILFETHWEQSKAGRRVVED